MRTTIVIALIAAGVLAAVPVLADRIIFAPTGTVLGGGEIKAEAAAGNAEGFDRVYWLGLGLQRLELNAFRLQDRGSRSTAPAGRAAAGSSRFDIGSELVGEDSLDVVNAEIGVLPETTLTPGIGVGVWDITNETKDGIGYFVAVSKALPLTRGIPSPIRDVRVHAGVGVGGIEGFFGGAEATILLGLRLYAEYFEGDFNFAVGWKVLPAVQLKAYLLGGDPFVGIQISPPL